METPSLEVRRRRGHALPGAVGVADFEPMLQTPPLVIDAEDDHEGDGFSAIRTLSGPR